VSKHVLFYEAADDMLEEAPTAFADARRDGAMAVFMTREAAEAFAEGDPFVLNKVVRAWEVREWNEVLAE